eukprot:COSAG01_NODE_57648_length_311_cov_0.485849_1_plen_76_part_01
MGWEESLDCEDLAVYDGKAKHLCTDEQRLPCEHTTYCAKLTASVKCSSRDHPAFFKQKTAYEILRSDWSSDVCSSD